MKQECALPSKKADSCCSLDLLATIPEKTSFKQRVEHLDLTPVLQKKIFHTEFILASGRTPTAPFGNLSVEDEKELAAEVLLRRHRFSEMLLARQRFRQAALSVLQNVYLFKNRKIFFGNTNSQTETERQEALLLFSDTERTSLPLEKTLQHLVIARIWNRILVRISPDEMQDECFRALHAVVLQLNTLRNIYMLLTRGLVRKLAAKTKAIYRESVTYEDAVQIGEIGVARAAYRYHQSCGVRFSTFAANWIFSEIQRQALQGRLIRLSTNVLADCTKAGKSGNFARHRKLASIIADASAIHDDVIPPSFPDRPAALDAPGKSIEMQQRRFLLLKAIDQNLSQKSGDIIKRRYGLPPYLGEEQSVVSISREYGVTRSSIYQLEQSALQKLQKHLNRDTL